jgi:predicted Zn-dependent protease
MRHFTFLIILFMSISTSFSQEITQEKIQKIIEDYKAGFDQVMVLKDCGHQLDVPIMWTKRIENNTLDAMLFITDTERKAMGEKIFRDMNRKRTILTNHWAKNDVTNILKKITANLNNSSKTYKLNIIKSQEINAFATMGGYVYLTTGLLEFVDSYDELAFIIGHEVAHEEKLHTQRKVTKLLVSSNLLSMVKLEDFKKLALNINAMLSAPFDQIDEYEADQYGVALAKKAGYNPAKFGDFFTKLAKYENKTLLYKLSSTHPFAQDRKNCIQEYLTN